MSNRTKPTSTPSVTVALTQMPCSPDPEQNLPRQLHLIEQAAARGAHIICTPELFKTHYFCQTEDHRFFDLAEPIGLSSSTAGSMRTKV
jgi:N-carbamoylputrescine amidase